VTAGSPIHVVSTTIPGTREALATAAALADGLDSHIRVIAAVTMPAAWSLDQLSEPHALAKQIRTLPEAESSRVRVLPCVCRHLTDITQLLPPNGLVIMGGRTHRWWPTREQRLAHDLQGLGYRVMFVLARAALLLLFAGFARTAVAQDQGQSSPAPLWQFGAFLDTADSGDFNTPPNHLFRNRGTTPRVDEVDLNMAGAYVRKTPADSSRWGVEATAHVGQDSETFGFSATAPNLAGAGWLRHLGPTNVSYLAPAGHGLTLQAGVFSSLIGYDSLYAKDNLIYTRPWGADYTPYLMMGINAAYPLTPRLTLTGVLVNGYWHLAHANDTPSVGGQVAYKADERVAVKQTVLYGPHQADTALEFWRLFSDSIVERRGPRLTTAAELQIGQERVVGSPATRALWLSAQMPVRWAVQGPWSIAIRPEFSWDRDGRWIGAPQSVAGVTTSLERRVTAKAARAIVRLEHRYDHSSGAGGGFFSDRGLVPGQQLLILAAIVAIGGAR
jgi:hypothetical protein